MDKKLEIVLAAKDMTKKVFTDLDGHMTRLSRSALSLRGVLTGLGGAAGIGYFIKSSLDAADAIGKTADKVGLTTGALQELRYAAGQSGVEQATLDMAMQRFSRRLGEAAMGAGELKDTLAMYGIAVTNADGSTRRTEEVLGDLADTMRGATSDNERLRIAFKAFDSEGAALVNMLRDGRQGLDGLRKEAQDLGLVMRDDLIRESTRATDEIDKLARVIKVNFRNAVAEMAPDITKWVSSLTSQTEDLKLYAQSLTEVSLALGKVAGWTADKLTKGGKGIGAGLAELLYGSGGGRVPTELGVDLDRLLGTGRKTPWDQYPDLYPGREDVPTGGAEPSGAGKPVIPPPSPGAFSPGVKSISDVLKAEEKARQAHEQRIESLLQARIRKETDFRQKAHQEAIQDLLDRQEEIKGIKDEALQEELAALQEAMEESDRIVEEATKETSDSVKALFGEDMKNAMAGWANDWSRSLNEMLWGAQVTFDDIFQGYAKMLTQMVIQKTAVEPMLQFGGGILEGVGGFLASLFGFNKGGVLKNGYVMPFAHGGLIPGPTVFPMARGLGLAGEEGPEAVMPLKRLPSGDLGVQASGGGSTQEVHIHNYTGQPVKTKKTRTASGGRALHVLVGEMIAGDVKTGGPVRSALEGTYGLRPTVGGR